MSNVKISTGTFSESSKHLPNSDCGPYRIYVYNITDEPENYMLQVEKSYRSDTDTTIALVEINLYEYRDGDISNAGLNNINALFDALREGGKRLIVRFLYDLDGKGLINEPDDLSVVLRHMEQLENIFRKYKESIFTVQGLFIGSWGEMHDTKFGSDTDLCTLAEKLFDVTDEKTYLAVRTPAQWRTVTDGGKNLGFAKRIGLFNDGMLGGETDLGTYDLVSHGDERRSRLQEMDFQNALCAAVPNGGEVVRDNPYNDFASAVNDLSVMHVTYINKDYDMDVLNKWAAATVSSNDCFNGMDGLTYIKRHLGYRLYISDVKIKKKLFSNTVSISVEFKNSGFAPLYAEPGLIFTIWDDSLGYGHSYSVDNNLCQLAGGGKSSEKAVVELDVPVGNFPKGSYSVYLDLTNTSTEERIYLANTQNDGIYGYKLGEIEIRFGPSSN